MHQRRSRPQLLGSVALSLILATPLLATPPVPSTEPPPPTVVDGSVIDPSGTAIEDARVRLWRLSDRQQRARILDDVTTDVDGRFSLTLEPSARFVVRVDAEHYVARTHELDSTRDTLEIILGDGPVGFGQVVDLEDRPIADARVALAEGVASEPIAVTTTDRDGRWRVFGLDRETIDLRLTARGFAPETVARIPIVVPPEPTDRAGQEAPEIDLGMVALLPGATIVGRVMDQEGEPVTAIVETATNRWPTDDQGSFVVEDLRPDSQTDLTIRADGYVPRIFRAVRAPTDEPLRVMLDAAARIHGRVIDQAGQPVPGAKLLYRLPGNATLPSAISDDDGGYRLAPLAPGGELVVDADGFLPFRHTALELQPGETRELDITLELGVRVLVEVTDPDGAPIHRAAVRSMRATTNGRGFDRTDENGHAELDGLDIGPHRLGVVHRDYLEVERVLDLGHGNNELSVVLRPKPNDDEDDEPGVTVSGWVRDNDGEAVAATLVVLRPTAAQLVRHRQSDADGRFVFEDVPAGRYWLSSEHRQLIPARERQPVDVADLDVEDIEIVLEKGAEIHGRVTGLDLDELATTEVLGGGRSAPVDASGEFILRHVPPGEVEVIGRVAESRRRASADVEVVRGETPPYVELIFEPGHPVNGRIFEGETPLAGASVSMWEKNGGGSGGSAQSGHDGRFVVEHLTPGEYYLRAGTRQLSTWTEVSVPTRATVELRLESGGVHGTVTDRDRDEPVAGAVVSLQSSSYSSGFGRRPPMTAVSDAEGRFHIDTVPTGTWEAVAKKAGYSPASRRFEIVTDQTTEGVALRLEPNGETRVPVVRGDGLTGGDVRVRVVQAGTTVIDGRHQLESDGTLRLDLAPGRYELFLQAPGTATHVLPLDAPGTASPVVLMPPARLELSVDAMADTRATATVESPFGSRHPRWHVRGLGAFSHPVVGGRLVIEDLPPGAWTVRIAGGGTQIARSVTAGPGEIVVVTVP